MFWTPVGQMNISSMVLICITKNENQISAMIILSH